MSSPKTVLEREVHRRLRDAHAALHGVAAFASLVVALHAWLHPASAPTC